VSDPDVTRKVVDILQLKGYSGNLNGIDSQPGFIHVSELDGYFVGTTDWTGTSSIEIVLTSEFFLKYQNEIKDQINTINLAGRALRVYLGMDFPGLSFPYSGRLKYKSVNGVNWEFNFSDGDYLIIFKNCVTHLKKADYEALA